MKKLIIVNGSPRGDEVSNTYRALMAEKEYFLEKYPGLGISYHKLPKDMKGCKACKNCIEGCKLGPDNFKKIVEDLRNATDLMLGSPVHLDMPSTQTVAFLTRLNSMAENTGREFFRDKRIWLVATGYCSGTKTCIHTMMGAAEMLGFTIPGRSTREYIVKWDDKKLRGGMNQTEAIILPEGKINTRTDLYCQVTGTNTKTGEPLYIDSGKCRHCGKTCGLSLNIPKLSPVQEKDYNVYVDVEIPGVYEVLYQCGHCGKSGSTGWSVKDVRIHKHI